MVSGSDFEIKRESLTTTLLMQAFTSVDLTSHQGMSPLGSNHFQASRKFVR